MKLKDFNRRQHELVGKRIGFTKHKTNILGQKITYTDELESYMEEGSFIVIFESIDIKDRRLLFSKIIWTNRPRLRLLTRMYGVLEEEFYILEDEVELDKFIMANGL